MQKAPLLRDFLHVDNELFRVHRLASCDSDHLVDVIYRTATAEVIYRTCDTLEDRSDCVSVSKSLNELVCDVTYLEAREYENVSVTGDL